MTLAKVQFKPGIFREGTQYSAGPTWYDCDKVRFRMGRPEKIGGWRKYSEDAIRGVTRSLFDWGTATQQLYLGIGTNLKFYVELGGAYSDITPIRATTGAGDVTFSATNGSSTVTISDTNHGAGFGDFVTFSGAASLGGNITAAVLNQEYQITNVPDGNSYDIEAKDTNGDTVTANASDTGNGGASTVGAYQVNVGQNNYQPSVGWSSEAWGSDPWGGGVSLGFSGQLRLYSQDVFGDDLIFNPREGDVYYWDESVGTGTRAVALASMGGASDAPTVAYQVMVSTLDRHVIAFGVNPLGSAVLDPLLVRWSDQENAVDWTPTAINTAGGQVLSSGTTIIGAIKTRQEILIFTDSTIHSMRYSGAPFVFQFAPVAENVSMLSPNAGVAVGDAVYFMDYKGFYIYQGSIQRIPCTVFDHVYSNLDRVQVFKIFALHNPDNSEVTWFYPAGSDGVTEINRYVTYNYAEQVWSIGTLVRGAWIQAATRAYPLAASADTANIDTNYIYEHEVGHDADGSEMAAYIESGELSIADGESLAFMRRFIPDFRFNGTSANADMTITIKGSDYPLDTPSTLATSTVTSSTKQNHVRVRAREIVMRVENSTGLDYGWTLGDFRFDLRTDGRRG